MKLTLLIVVICAMLVGCEDSIEPREKSSSENMVEDAYLLCSAFEETGFTSECEVKGWGMTVDTRIDTSGSEAMKICRGTVELLSKHTIRLKGKWKLRIFSPFSGDHPLAVCAF